MGGVVLQPGARILRMIGIPKNKFPIPEVLVKRLFFAVIDAGKMLEALGYDPFHNLVVDEKRNKPT
jgi:hypothetical protein